jgi:hypothetical protein
MLSSESMQAMPMFLKTSFDANPLLFRRRTADYTT